MLIHEELRRARERAEMTQAELAARAGIPRNQVVRAERGENITLDTLRRIAAHLPLDQLTLLENLQMKIDVVPAAEKILDQAVGALLQAMRTLGATLNTARLAHEAVLKAHQEAQSPAAEDPGLREMAEAFAQLGDLYQTLESKVDDVRVN
jgi:transcriptional regulator with XRE-family HTH domain